MFLTLVKLEVNKMKDFLGTSKIELSKIGDLGEYHRCYITGRKPTFLKIQTSFDLL